MTQYLTLYLDLEKDSQPDLEVISKASIEFSRLVREIARNIDPTIELSLALESGTEGSLKLNTIVKSIQERAIDKKTYKKIAIASAIFIAGAFSNDVAGRMISEFNDTLFGEEDSLSQNDLDAIAGLVDCDRGNSLAQEHTRGFYKELQADPVIKGVGVTPQYNTRPSVIVPSTEFKERSVGSPVTIEKTNRTTSEIVDVILISPVLLESARKWRFKGEGPEFGAQIKDKEFLKSVVDGSYHLEMKGGLKMTIELERIESFEGGVWKTNEISVLKVIKSENGPSQLNLLDVH